ncbi:MAG: ABC transporter ATP-binding protein [Aigarchaeota archaeon]|nr:ABC transporter ATP-binding protein [Aigarchaeota archaeon]
MVSVRTVDLCKNFGETVAVDHVDLESRDKEFVTLLGPSGCGKTTTLRIIAGLVRPDGGSVYFGDENVTELPPHKRKIGFVFQRIALFPHMNVAGNIAFGLKELHLSKDKIKQRTKEVLELVRMPGFEKRTPRQLSGGQAQRVEIARVLAIDPEVLLFDEPLSNLDAKLRDELKYEIHGIQRATGKTAIFVTHDQAEAFAISDRIYVMNKGAIQQVGTPVELYRDPKTEFVADFIGTSNFIPGKITRVEPGRVQVEVDLEKPFVSTEATNIGDFRQGQEVLVSLRPEDIEATSEEAGNKYQNVLEGLVSEATFVGLTTRLVIKVDHIGLKVDVQGPHRFRLAKSKGEKILLGFNRFTLVRGGS